MGNGTAAVLEPTFNGYVASTHDALILFEACLTGVLHHVPRRPHDRERAQLVRSGSVFIYEENASGIKRWTDGVTWSPSRILGNFLVYRELDKPFPPGEKKRAMKK
ncbi:Global transcription regulator sge1, partial [Ophidiomyces ophidiicola]